MMYNKIYIEKRNNLLIMLILSFLLSIYTNSHAGGGGGNGLSLDRNGWESFAKKIKCHISSKSKYAAPTKNRFPIIKVRLQYNGNKEYALAWDKNFAKVLWDGRFVLVCKKGSKKINTSQMKFRTSNTYAPEKRIKMIKNKRIQSVLNFNKLPGKYAKGLFNHKKSATFALYVKVKGKLKKISNNLVIKIR